MNHLVRRTQWNAAQTDRMFALDVNFGQAVNIMAFQSELRGFKLSGRWSEQSSWLWSLS